MSPRCEGGWDGQHRPGRSECDRHQPGIPRDGRPRPPAPGPNHHRCDGHRTAQRNHAGAAYGYLKRSAGPTATNPPAPGNPPSGDYQPAFPIRAAFYYPWFPEAWNQQGYNPFTNYTPSLGYYDSSTTPRPHQRHDLWQYPGRHPVLVGQGSPTDKRVAPS